MILAIAASTVTASLPFVTFLTGSGPTVVTNTVLVVTATLWTAFLVLGATDSITRRIDRDQIIRSIRSTEDIVATGGLRRSHIRPVD